MQVTAQLCDKIEAAIIDETRKAGFKLITYKDLAKVLGMGVHQPNLVSALESVGSRSYNRHGFFLTSLVISSKSKKQCASFWNAVHYNDVYVYDRRLFVEHQIAKSLDYCKRMITQSKPIEG